MQASLVLESKTDLILGTSFVVDDEARRAEETTILDPNLKYDKSGPTPIILVPQPSDDPNDPLVCTLNRIISAELTRYADLAPMATRLHTFYSLLPRSHSLDSLPASGSRFCDPSPELQVHLRQSRATYRLPPPRCRRRRFSLCSFVPRLGQEAYLPHRHNSHNILVGMGGLCRREL